MAVQQLQHTHGTTVVPSDTLYLFQSLGYPYRVSSALFVGVGGSVRVLTEGGDDVVFSSVPDGTFMPVHVVKVFATGTTASSIVAVDLSNLSTYSYLLDTYSGAAAAYSLRQLSSSYSGSAIRVRRASDNTEQNIGFASNELDVTALTSFCSGTNGFVTTWYDQSGNGNDATQTTAANQPQIVSSGSVILENGKPTIDHTASTTLNLSSNLNLLKTYSLYGVVKFDSYGREILGSGPSPYSYAIYQDSTSNYHAASNRSGSSTGVFGLNFALLSVYRNNTVAISQYKNTTILGTAFNLSNNADFLFRSLSGEQNSLYNLDGKLSEAIIYDTYQFSNQSGLEGNIKTYYGL